MNFVFANEAMEAAKKLNWRQKFKVRFLGNKLSLGEEKRKGWVATSEMFLFWCGACKSYAKGYFHGFKKLNCSNCWAQYEFASWAELRQKDSAEVESLRKFKADELEPKVTYEVENTLGLGNDS